MANPPKKIKSNKEEEEQVLREKQEQIQKTNQPDFERRCKQIEVDVEAAVTSGDDPAIAIILAQKLGELEALKDHPGFTYKLISTIRKIGRLIRVKLIENTSND